MALKLSKRETYDGIWREDANQQGKDPKVQARASNGDQK